MISKTKGRALKRSPLAVLILTVMMDLIGFGIIIPILPLYAKNFGASGLQVGLLMGIFSLMQLVFLPFWGRLSDRIGRRPVLLISIAGNAVSLLICALASDYWTLFVARLFAGVCSSNISVANAYIADSTELEHRAKGMGKIGAARGIGFVLGPALGGGLAEFGTSIPFYGATLLALLNLASAYFFLEESLPARLEGEHAGKSRFELLKIVRSLKNLRALIALGAFQTLAFSMLEMSFVLFTENRLELSAQEAAPVAGYLFLYLGVVIAVVQGGLIGRLTHLFGEQTLVSLGLLLVGVGMYLLTLTPVGNFAALLGFVAVVAIGQSLVTPSLLSLISRNTPSDNQGAIMGVNQSGLALARTIGPAVAGGLFDINENLPFWVGGSLMLLAFAGSWTILRRARISARLGI